MPFRLTNAGEYAVRLMVYLAGREPQSLVSAREIAENQNIPQRFLRSIVSQFTKLGYLNSYQGNNGGVCLAAGAEKTSLLEVIEAVEGAIYLNVCMRGEEVCSFSETCAVHLIWREAQEAVQKILGGKTIKELAATNLQLAAALADPSQMCGVPAVNTEELAVNGR